MLNQGVPVNVLPFPLEVVSDLEYRTAESFNRAVEEYFIEFDRRASWGNGGPGMTGKGTGYPDGGGGQDPMGGGEPGTTPEELRILRTIHQQEETIGKLESSVIEDRERGERMFLKYTEFEGVIRQIRSYGEEHGWDEMARALKNHPRILEVNTAEKYVVLADEPTNIRLDYMGTLNENAARYYDAVTRAREKLEGARTALAQSRERLQQVKREARKAEERKAVERKRFWFERYRWFISSGGHVIVGGKDAYTNDRVVKKYLKERDRYVHADIHGAPSLVIKTIPDREIDDQTLEEACIYAASFSRAWRAGIGGVDAYWVLPDQVSKTPSAGEFIAKGAFIIRGKRNRINATLRLAVGKITYQGVEMLMCAPEGSVSAFTRSYLIIEPGDIPKNEFARKLSRYFEVGNEEALSILPGDVRVAQVRGLDWTDG